MKNLGQCVSCFHVNRGGETTTAAHAGIARTNVLVYSCFKLFLLLALSLPSLENHQGCRASFRSFSLEFIKNSSKFCFPVLKKRATPALGGGCTQAKPVVTSFRGVSLRSLPGEGLVERSRVPSRVCESRCPSGCCH